MKYSRNEIFSIPNVLSYFRLALIPVFIYTYVFIDTTSIHILTTVILILASITDFLDGFIARKFHMITELGKLIDPVADKFYQLTLAAVLMYHYPLMGIVGIVIAIEDGILLFLGYYVFALYGYHIPQAKMPGKVSTAVYFVFTIILAAIDLSSSFVSVIMIIVMAVLMSIAAISYTREIMSYYHKGKVKTNG